MKLMHVYLGVISLWPRVGHSG